MTAPPVIGSLWTLLGDGNILQYFIVLLNQYFPFGILFWFVGIIIFGTVQYSTKNFAFAGIVATVFFFGIGSSGIVTSVYSAMAMRYFAVIMGCIVAYALYRGTKN